MALPLSACLYLASPPHLLDASGVGDTGVDDTGGDSGETQASHTCALPGSQDLSVLSRDHRLGPDDNGIFGVALAAGTDLDGDGDPDLVVGAPRTANRDGAVYLFRGEAAGLGDTTAVLSGVAGEHFGAAVVLLDGDDGPGDLAVSAWESDTVYLFRGPVTGARTSAEADATVTVPLFDGDLARAGDMTGDGRDDLLVAYVEEDTSGVWLLDGQAPDAPPIVLSEERYPQAGRSVAGGEDLSGDGLPDIVVGADHHESGGAVYVVHGPVAASASLSYADALLTGSDGVAGWAVAMAGDTDGDGYGDLLVGDYGLGRSDQAGGAYLVRGPVDTAGALADADAVLYADPWLTGTGMVVAGGGDLDGDGRADVAIAAPGGRLETAADAWSIYDPSAVYAWFGPFAGSRDVTEAGFTMTGTDDKDAAGSGLAFGRVGPDLVDRLFVGSPGDDEGGNYAGRVDVVGCGD